MEEWERHYKKEELLHLQNLEKKLLDVFIEICDKNELEYILYGGSLLGSVKYGSMVPWDDDIDVALPRESYIKFIQTAEQNLTEEYFIQNPENNPKCPFPYTKLRLRGTKYTDYANRNVDVESGIYIDIYPIDKIPDKEKLRKKQFYFTRFWILLFVYRQTPLYDKKERGVLINAAKWVICNSLKIFPSSFYYRRINRWMTKYNNLDTERFAALNSPNIDNTFNKLYPLKEMDFDGRKVYAPADFEGHLKRRYGDIDVLPPESMRVGHIPYILEFGKYTIP